MNKSPQPAQGGSVRKRQKIEDSAKQMFFWVAGMSAVIGLALVVSWFMWQQGQFKSKVAGEKEDTARTLLSNIEAAPELRTNIRVLETNSALAESKADNNQRALQVILDALPSESNSLALGASLQQRLTSGISGLDIESLTVTPTEDETSGVGMVGDGSGLESEDATAGSPRIEFNMTANARDAGSIDELLKRFERSIRVIDVERLSLERSDQRYTVSILAHGYYQPAKTIQLTSKAVHP